MKQFIPPGGLDRVPDFDPRTGAHLWALLVMYRVDPVRVVENPGETVHLDTENMLHIGAVGCFYCEQVYLPHLLHRRCPGERS